MTIFTGSPSSPNATIVVFNVRGADLSGSDLCNSFSDETYELVSGLELTSLSYTAPFDCSDIVPMPPSSPPVPQAPTVVVIDPDHCNLRWMFSVIIAFSVISFAFMLGAAACFWYAITLHLCPHHASEQYGLVHGL